MDNILHSKLIISDGFEGIANDSKVNIVKYIDDIMDCAKLTKKFEVGQKQLSDFEQWCENATKTIFNQLDTVNGHFNDCYQFFQNEKNAFYKKHNIAFVESNKQIENWLKQSKLQLSKNNEEYIFFLQNPEFKGNVIDHGIAVESYHVSCQSDSLSMKLAQMLDSNNNTNKNSNNSNSNDNTTNNNMGGIILYTYDNKTDWYLNNIHCKSGYIIIKNEENLKNIGALHGVIHGDVYKSVFDCEIDDKVVGAGFAFHNGKWKFNSYTFNTGTKYHDNLKAMHPLEKELVKSALQNWANHCQNTRIDKKNLKKISSNKSSKDVFD